MVGRMAAMAEAGAEAWVVDLRGNGGGLVNCTVKHRMNPMLSCKA